MFISLELMGGGVPPTYPRKKEVNYTKWLMYFHGISSHQPVQKSMEIARFERIMIGSRAVPGVAQKVRYPKITDRGLEIADRGFGIADRGGIAVKTETLRVSSWDYVA